MSSPSPGRRPQEAKTYRQNLPAHAARRLIRIYQLTLSALIGQRCRYLPSCSHYMDGAIAKHGFWAGAWAGLARVCRCHPWGGAGYDPVPEELPADAAWWRPWSYGIWRWPQE